MDNQIIKVQTFQDFSVSCGQEIVLSGYFQNSKVILLLQFLLVHHKQGVTKDTLIDLMYRNKETDNPANALKLLVHRLRKLFTLSGFPDYEYIKYSNGSYQWNNEIPVEIDFEQFELEMKRAAASQLSFEECLNHYKNAIDLYKGDFLPSLVSEDWAIPFFVRYQELYHDCIRNVTQILKEQERFHEMLDIGTRAISVCPSSEEFHKIRIISLFALRHYKDAKAAYEQTVDILYDELGVNPSEDLALLYKELSAALQDEATSIYTIKESIQEETMENGAYFCNIQTFTNIYHMIVRSLERNGQSCFLMLCTLENKNKNSSSDKSEHSEAVAKLQYAIKDTLRRGDLFTRYSKRQYLILLVGINQENCNLVMQRIDFKFKDTFKGKGLKLKYKSVSAAETDFIMGASR